MAIVENTNLVGVSNVFVVRYNTFFNFFCYTLN